jgi:hypothetical protein
MDPNPAGYQKNTPAPLSAARGVVSIIYVYEALNDANDISLR